MSAPGYVAMPPELVLELKKRRLACPKGEMDLVFPNQRGGALHEPERLRAGTSPGAAARRPSGDTLHGFRHGFGSMLVRAGGLGYR